MRTYRTREAKIERNRQIFEILSKEGEWRIAMHSHLSLDSEEYDSDMIEYLGDETSEKLAFLFLKFVCLNYNSKVIQPLN